MPRVSILLPCRDAARHLGAAVASIRGQTFEDYEVVAVDDGSADETFDLSNAIGLMLTAGAFLLVLDGCSVPVFVDLLDQLVAGQKSIQPCERIRLDGSYRIRLFGLSPAGPGGTHGKAAAGESVAAGSVEHGSELGAFCGGNLLKRAELALYEAKSAGRGTLRFFKPDMEVAAADRLALTSDLRHAPKEGGFLLYYQPLVDAQTGDSATSDGMKSSARTSACSGESS